MKRGIFVFAGAMLLVLVSGCSTRGKSVSQLNAPPGAPPPPAIYLGQAYSAAPAMSPPPVYVVPPTEEYAEIEENTFKQVNNAPLSTFSIDVDTASYANVRRILNDGQLPIPDAVRVEELINYFPYDYPQPAESDGPFSVTTEVGPCLWNPAHRLARIGLKGLEMDAEDRPRANLVFLLDVSGSMQPDNKLPLVKRALRLLVPQLHPEDRLGIVTYAGQAGVALESMRCTENNRKHILEVIDGLGAGGSTHGAAGIKTAYNMVNEEFRKNGINRVILCTDGDFNVGVTDEDKLVELITDNAKNGVFFTVLGFGMGNLKDDRLETLADEGNGAYGYIDSLTEARKVFLEEMTGTLVTIAKDVKIQVEFNPARVAGYRLVGYENRMLTAEEFNDDTKDAGEIGAGHTVTALYEIVPAGQEIPGVNIDELRYQQTQPTEAAMTDELFLVKVRYKEPRGEDSALATFPVRDTMGQDAGVTTDFQFASSVAAFGMLLRKSEFIGEITYDDIIAAANASRGVDGYGYRAEFVNLVRNAAAIAGSRKIDD